MLETSGGKYGAAYVLDRGTGHLKFGGLEFERVPDCSQIPSSLGIYLRSYCLRHID